MPRLLHIKAHIAAGLGLLSALLIAVFAFGMPTDLAARAAFLGGLTGLLPIGWIVLNIIFLQQLAEQNGSFKVLQARRPRDAPGVCVAVHADGRQVALRRQDARQRRRIRSFIF